MYQFYMSNKGKGFVQVYNDGDITKEYARQEIDSLTDGHSDEYDPVSLSFNLFGFKQIILPFSVSDKAMNFWKFSSQFLEMSGTYEESAIDPYFAVDVDYDQDGVQVIDLK